MNNNPNLENNRWVQRHGFSAGERTLYKGRIIQPHWHNYYELEIITRGKVRHTLNKDTAELQRGSIYFLTPTDFHSIISLEETDIINIAFTNNMISSKLIDYLNQPIQHTFFLKGADFEYFEGRAQRIAKENESNIFKDEIASAIITEMLYLLFRALSSESFFNQSPSLLQSAISIINKHYMDNITIQSVSDELHVTPQYLGKLFKERMNTSMTDYLTNLKLKHACHMLIHSDIPIKDLAFESGYNSVEYFLYVFKKNIKTTPSEYRRTNKEKSI